MMCSWRALVFLGACSASVYGQTTAASDGHALVDAEEDGGGNAQKTSDHNRYHYKHRFQYKLLAGVNATLGNRVAKQLEYELRLSTIDINGTEVDVDMLPARSKVGLAVIHALGLHCCGVDRCFMGQTCLGVVKGLTLGGLLVWAVVDVIAVLWNMLNKDVYMDVVGFKAKWDEKDINAAFWICVVGLFGCACFSGTGCKGGAAGQGDHRGS